MHRENLVVLTNHSALRIRIKNRRAVAVETQSEVEDVLISARREIILSAGSFHSPEILMLSGIGPRDVLERHGVSIVHEANEVGRNYQDHVGAPVTRKLKGAYGLHGSDRGWKAIKNGFDYLVFKRVLLTSNLLQAGA